ncbi:Isopentenyl-diphosphate delta-isomerase [Actinomadura rubteroloni]|uniref:Isopentenyl-diphosphate delta-isomerase n=1 Tax=Actinomadura rubteroloni TaxID=1926885 RepID=A0A2P4UEZ6_9ACTN|nr:type 2 isopentenyl-diphosphate Delta-isomerase [Actinomadura rubteroloni]POM23588.1 Isopentenyl-diphosphate delta-isomerase [Actinomadura rubteroloni]
MTGNRKDDHVRYAVDQQRRSAACNDFDAVNFLHHALAGIDRDTVDLGVKTPVGHWPVPLYINAMTGGSDQTGRINRQLAVAARETGLPVASGSMSAYLRDPDLGATFRTLRDENPDGVVIANVNANATVDQARRAVDLLGADALQIHLNAVQEIVMPEGDRDFAAWPGRVERIVAGAGVPVIVKEVGFGLSRRTVARLRDLGVAAADVAGRGGTNFARIENDRRPRGDYAFVDGWGQSTACCLLDAAGAGGIFLLGSGGVRSPLDVARALALGAGAVGVAGRFLGVLTDRGTEALVAEIRAWLEALTGVMTVLGAASPADLHRCDLLLTGDVAEYCRARGIDPAAYSSRSVPT